MNIDDFLAKVEKQKAKDGVNYRPPYPDMRMDPDHPDHIPFMAHIGGQRASEQHAMHAAIKECYVRQHGALRGDKQYSTDEQYQLIWLRAIEFSRDEYAAFVRATVDFLQGNVEDRDDPARPLWKLIEQSRFEI